MTYTVGIVNLSIDLFQKIFLEKAKSLHFVQDDRHHPIQDDKNKDAASTIQVQLGEDLTGKYERKRKTNQRSIEQPF